MKQTTIIALGLMIAAMLMLIPASVWAADTQAKPEKAMTAEDLLLPDIFVQSAAVLSCNDNGKPLAFGTGYTAKDFHGTLNTL